MKKLVFMFLFLGICVSAMAQKKSFSDYVGKYSIKNAPFSYLIVTVENDVLMGEAEGVGKGELKASSTQDVFEEDNNSAQLKFIRDKSQNVIAVEIEAQGMYFKGEKEDEYSGEYVMNENPHLDQASIKKVDGSLVIETSVGNSELAATDQKDIFELKAVDGKVAFKRDSSGKVVGIEIMAMGVAMEGNKK